MQFALNDAQEAVSKSARRVLQAMATPDRLDELDAQGVEMDSDLWKALAEADLLGIALPEAVGGSEQTFGEVCALLVEVGRSVAPVPVLWTLLAAEAVVRHGTQKQIERYVWPVADGGAVLTCALTESRRGGADQMSVTATETSDGWALAGARSLVPWAPLSECVLVPAVFESGEVGVWLVDPRSPGVTLSPIDTTSNESRYDLELVDVRMTEADLLGGVRDGEGIVADFSTRILTALCAVQLGVSEEALRLSAEYVTTREQFDRPIGSFQAVQHRLADAFIDVEAMRWTTWHAAWRIAEGMPSDRQASIAKFWASEAGARVAASAQQVHGGMGIDVSYPLYRYFLWSKQLELELGAAPVQLVKLGNTYL